MTPVPRGTAGDKSPGRPVTLTARDVSPRSRPAAIRIFLAIFATLLVLGFAALGTWQLKRLQWKLDLIERVDQRVHAPAIAAPGTSQWSGVNADADEYRHVRVTGKFLYTLTVRVQASTEMGSGFWLLTPLRSEDGSITLINRGFVPPNFEDQNDSLAASDYANANADNSAHSVVTGLLRMSEPGGGFLRHNDAANNRWYSRDVQAIALARGLRSVAPYFIDQEAGNLPSREKGNAAKSRQPVAGLTVIAFHNNHLVYALTWFALALMLAGAGFWVVREDLHLLRVGRENARNDPDNGPGVNRESEDAKKK